MAVNYIIGNVNTIFNKFLNQNLTNYLELYFYTLNKLYLSIDYFCIDSKFKREVRAEKEKVRKKEETSDFAIAKNRNLIGVTQLIILTTAQLSMRINILYKSILYGIVYIVE